MLAIHDKSSQVIGAFIAIDPRTGDFDEIFIQAFSENEQQVVEQAVARIMRPTAKELLKQLLRMLGADILHFIRIVKLIKKLKVLQKVTPKRLSPLSPKARCPNGNK